MNRIVFFLLLVCAGVVCGGQATRWTRDEWRATREGVIENQLYIARSIPRYRSWTNNDCARIYIVRHQISNRRVFPSPRWIDTNSLLCPLGITNYPSR